MAGVVGAIAGATILGAALDFWLRRRHNPKEGGGLQGWALGMLLSSYAALVPGLVLCLFRFEVKVKFMPTPLADGEENTFALVHRMSTNGLVLGALLVTTYAMVIPVFKVILLILSQVWQRGNPAHIHWARMCIVIVQTVSKWACPDMFAYILLMYLFRSLDAPPKLRSGMQLGGGFACFCAFCIGSTVSSLGLGAPPAKVSPRCAAHGPSSRVALFAVAPLALAFLGLLVLGFILPCLELHLDMALLYEYHHELQAYSLLLTRAGIEQLLHQQVSIFRCVAALGHWTLEGDATILLALVMYVVFVIVLPVVDVLALLYATYGRPTERCGGPLAVSHVLSKLCMLDVSTMGVLVVVASMQNMREKGVVLAAQPGALALLAAEFCHYAMAFLAHGAHREAEARAVEDKSSTEMATDAPVGEAACNETPGSIFGQQWRPWRPPVLRGGGGV